VIFAQTKKHIKEELIQSGKFLFSRNLLPATSGNLSIKDPENSIITITVSGKSKGSLGLDDFIEIDHQANILDPKEKRPSAETLLHTQIYNFFQNATVVFHTHSINGVIISKIIGANGVLELKNYELLKAFRGVQTHAHTEQVPVFANNQNIKQLAEDVEQFMRVKPDIHGYLIEGHGLYTWGTNVQEALRNIEAFEALFEMEIKLRELKQKS
jgi:methylthioribulose-1-phosphate dehydratase